MDQVTQAASPSTIGAIASTGASGMGVPDPTGADTTAPGLSPFSATESQVLPDGLAGVHVDTATARTPRITTAALTEMAMLLALICVSAYISIPLPFTPVPLTAQTLAINLTAMLLKPKQTALVLSSYILIGLCGLPVFAGGTSGPGKLFGPTGGYILGFLAAGVLISLLKGKKYNLWRYFLIATLVGIPAVYLLGSIMMMLLVQKGFIYVLGVAVIPYIPLDIVKAFIAACITLPLSRAAKQ
ncbi:MAG: biotin transporter BioY [Lachnospiraceae bacterium]|jgi:biotin transport system substrate-specific component|nr:biotin transporter BioY [Lachnospiraceae bacterium]